MMKFRSSLRVSRSRSRPLSRQCSSMFFSLFSSISAGPSFGIAFDIDGVILAGRTPIGGSPKALRRLNSHSGITLTAIGDLKMPFIFLTNGGGVPESRRASELSEVLGINISPSQVVQGHSPFKGLLKMFENELIVATGKGEPAVVMSEYGFKKVLSLDEYVSYFKNIDPVAQYKTWITNQASTCNGSSSKLVPNIDVYSDEVKAAFVVSDPVDWGRDIQVLCDILRSSGRPGKENGQQPFLYFAADDLEYQAAFPSKRLGMGAFRIALESVFNRIHHSPLKYTSFGKPNPFVFKNAESILRELHPSAPTTGTLKTLYMVGDNPSVDVKGAKQAGHPWFSILTRTGVFRGKDNDSEFPADMVVDDVEQAVEFILEKEGVCHC